MSGRIIIKATATTTTATIFLLMLLNVFVAFTLVYEVLKV